MKLLGLLRHAKSSWDDPAVDDFARPLNERGRKAALRMGDEFRGLGLSYELALVSTARRAADTFALLCSRWEAEVEFRAEPRLYAASVEDLLNVVAETPPQIESLLLVGHNPGLHLLATHLTTGDRSPDAAALAFKLPTGALAEIRLCASWAQAANARAGLLRFVRPRHLK